MSNQPTDSDTPGPVGADMYDDPADSAVDPAKLLAWLTVHRTSRSASETREQMIGDVLAALQAVGDATLVKNPTYRMLRRDGAAVERLNAWLQNHGVMESIVKHNGDAVAAMIALDPFDWDS